MPEREDADTLGLGETAEVRDRDAGHAVDGVDIVELQRVDDEMETVRQSGFRRLFGCGSLYDRFLRCTKIHARSPGFWMR